MEFNARILRFVFQVVIFCVIARLPGGISLSSLRLLAVRRKSSSSVHFLPGSDPAAGFHPAGMDFP